MNLIIYLKYEKLVSVLNIETVSIDAKDDFIDEEWGANVRARGWAYFVASIKMRQLSNYHACLLSRLTRREGVFKP